MNEKERQTMLSQISTKKRSKELNVRKNLDKKYYLSDLIKKDNPRFESNNLILSPVGSGKSHLIEELLIPENYDKDIIYLTSNTALKDSLCPDDNEIRKILAKAGESKGFFTSANKNRFGNVPYKVHVMTYSEFGERIHHPDPQLIKNVGLIFCDEIHSLPKYFEYDNSYKLGMALNWLFRKHEEIQIFYFTATQESIDSLEKRKPGYLKYITIFDYLSHEDIVKYVAKTTHYISHINQLRVHLRSKKEAFDYYNLKALAFTRLISDQEKIENIAKEEGFKPITLWSVNNDNKVMNDEQKSVREHILNTGLIPKEYNLLIINGSMQEGWNLYDDKVSLAILNTTDITEQVQALGRIRKDIDLVIKRTNDDELVKHVIDVPEEYLNKPLTTDNKNDLCEELKLLNSRGNLRRWTSVKRYIIESGYNVKESFIDIEEKQTRVSIITEKESSQ